MLLSDDRKKYSCGLKVSLVRIIPDLFGVYCSCASDRKIKYSNL